MSEQAHDHELIRKSASRVSDTTPDPAPDINPLARLQRMIGNRAVQRLVTPRGMRIQPKMTVTAAHDSSESEADVIADEVVRKVQRQNVQRAEEDELQAKRIQREGMEDEEIQAKRIQREGMEDEEIQAKRIQREGMEDEEIQAKRIQREAGDMMDAFNVGSDFEASLDKARSGGRPIDDGVRTNLESAMGADFSGVRVHEGKESDSLNGAIQARAFTTGSDIFFRSGEYNPSSTEGQKLLAHELTHTIQQGAVNPKREDGKS